MTLPGVRITEIDGSLGVIQGSNGRMPALIAPASGGDDNTPGTFARVKDLVSEHDKGPAVEWGAYFIETYQRPLIVVKSAASVASAVSAVDDGVSAGTSAVTVDTGPTPADDYELALEVLTGGTVGTAGITYRMSLDGGRTWSSTYALGTATKATFPDGAGVAFAFGTGTLVTGDLFTATATAAAWNATDLGAALNALKATQIDFGLVVLQGGAVDANSFDTAEGVRAFANGRHAWVGNSTLPTSGQSESAYATSLTALSTGKSSKGGSVYAGACRATSAISQRRFVRPASWGAAARQAFVSEQINIADPKLGALPGISIRDANGNPEQHDESINPGLDDLRFATLTSFPRRQGAYVTLPRVFAPTGSDFDIMPNRLIMDLAYDALYDYLLDRLHSPIQVSRKTGYILPAVAKDIELGADSVLRTVLLTTPKASDAFFRMSRTDNLLSLPKFTCFARILPLSYPRWIDLDMSFTNPATQLVAA